MRIPCYPTFVNLDIELKESLHPRLSLTSDGVSEFTFSGLYLFRNRYKYRISRESPDGNFIISGIQPAHGTEQSKTFFMTPCGAPKTEILESLFETHDYWKNISESVLSPVRSGLSETGINIEEDRDNFDYLYSRKDMAELSGKKFHKKKNLVNQFLNMCPDHEQRQMTAALIPQAIDILNRWQQHKSFENNGRGDYDAAREALESFDTLNLRGSIFFVNGNPAAYCLGESIAKGKMFAVHFEKGVDDYKGIYQFMNQAFAAALPGFFTWINREQDLGDEGLRHAKTSYRPCGFVQKYTGRRL